MRLFQDITWKSNTSVDEIIFQISYFRKAVSYLPLNIPVDHQNSISHPNNSNEILYKHGFLYILVNKHFIF